MIRYHRSTSAFWYREQWKSAGGISESADGTKQTGDNATSERVADAERAKNLNDLERYIETQCELIVVITEDLSEAFQFFDSQNARGKALYPHDLLKAYHLREMENLNSEETEQIVRRWENLDQKDLAALFNGYLYRLKCWIHGNYAGELNEQNIDMFKGLTAKERYPYAQYYKSAFAYADHLNHSSVPLVTGLQPMTPFQIYAPIIAGKPFFEYAEHYFSILKDIFDAIYGDGQKESDGVPLFVFNYMDFRIWKYYADTLRGESIKKESPERKAFFAQLGCNDFGLDIFNQFYISRTRRSLEHFYPQANVGDGLTAPTEDQINCFGNYAMIGNEVNSAASNWSPKNKLDTYLDPSGKISRISVASLKFTIMLQMCRDRDRNGCPDDLTDRQIYNTPIGPVCMSRREYEDYQDQRAMRMPEPGESEDEEDKDNSHQAG